MSYERRVAEAIYNRLEPLGRDFTTLDIYEAIVEFANQEKIE